MRARTVSMIGAAVFLIFGSVFVLGLLGVWQRGDHLVFRTLYVPEIPLPASGVQIVDVRYPDELRQDENPRAYREALGHVLQSLANMPLPPRTVIIDVWFSRHEAGQDAVLAGIKALQNKGSRVIVAVVPIDRHGHDSIDFMQRHNQAIYSAADGYGHTQLDSRLGILKYEREIRIQAQAAQQNIGTLSIPALPPLAVIDSSLIQRLPESLVIPLGNDESWRSSEHIFNVGKVAFEPPMPSGSPISHVIIGSLAADSDNVLNRPGPLLLAWAVSDLLAGQGSGARAPLNDWRTLLGLCLMALAIAMLTQVVVYRFGASLRVTATLMPRYIAITSVGAFGISVASLVVVGFVLAQGGRLIPVTLPATFALIGSGIAFYVSSRDWGKRMALLDRKILTDHSPIEWDIFISYAHNPVENMKWVEEHVYQPLSELRHEDDRPFKIFFDKSAIEAGEGWQRKIDRSLIGTMIFIPIFSAEYVGSDYCMYEWVAVAKERVIHHQMQVLPISRIPDSDIPESVHTGLQQIQRSSDVTPQWLKENVVRLWQKQHELRE